MAQESDAFVIIDLNAMRLHMVRLNPPLVESVTAEEVGMAFADERLEAGDLDALLLAALTLAFSQPPKEEQLDDLRERARAAREREQGCLVLRYDPSKPITVITARGTA